MRLLESPRDRAGLLILALGVAILLALTPFLSGLLGAAVLYVLFVGLHRRLVRVMPNGLASALTLIAAIILIALPSAIFGALIPINLGLASINIYTQVGLVTLIGLISKHGILMVDYANQLQEKEGLDRRAAIEKAAAIRLRPILMTTAAMVVGMVPLLTASGAGAASRYSIGLVIAAGMTIGTLFTLFVTPAVYTYVAREHRAHAAAAPTTTTAGAGAGADH